MQITLYEVTLQNAVGRTRVENVVATTDTSASNAAIKRAERETEEGGWRVVRVLPAI